VKPEDLNTGDFFWYMSDIYTMGVQYGKRTELCEMIAANANGTQDEQLTASYNYGVGKGVSYD